MRRPKLVDRIEEASVLDSCAGPLRRAASWLRRGRAGDALHGVWLGHPAHPMLVQLPIGAWLSSGLLDTLPRQERASRRLAQIGLVAVVPAALTGMADWSQQNERQRRVGLVHAAANGTAAALYAASLTVRSRGHGVYGRALGYAGLAAVGVGGFLGGHIAYRQAGGVNRAEGVRRALPREWRSVGPLKELPEREPTRRTVDGCDLVLVRGGETVYALVETCSHQAGPLADGELVGADAREGTLDDACVRCPLHGSEFRIGDGDVVHGPATAPQPALLTRIRDGVVEVRPAAGG